MVIVVFISVLSSRTATLLENFEKRQEKNAIFTLPHFAKVFFSRHYLLVKKWSLHRALKTEGGSVQCGGDEGNNDAILFLWLMLYVTLKMILFSLSSCNILD